MKGIVLAGGRGTRLAPLTTVISKQLLPVYNKPMIYYPLQTLKSMGITEILIIVADELQFLLFRNQLDDGSKYGLNLKYAVQKYPGGLPEAFLIADECGFITYADDVTLILGDNVFIDSNITSSVPNTIYTYKVKNPCQYGVVVTDENGQLDRIVEKPKEFISDTAVVGLYTVSHEAVVIAKQLKPSSRGELEIVELIDKLNYVEGVNIVPLNGFWFDCGTTDDLIQCANLVNAIEDRTNTIVGLHE